MLSRPFPLLLNSLLAIAQGFSSSLTLLLSPALVFLLLLLLLLLRLRSEYELLDIDNVRSCNND